MKILTKKITGLAFVGVSAITIATGIIKPWEGRSLVAYQDIVKVWTICDGETKGVRPGQKATHAECDKMLARSVKEHAAGLDRCLKANLPVRTKGALISWTYNVGVGAACKSTLVRKANAGDFRGACLELPKWNRAGGNAVRGLTDRRAAEMKECLAGLKDEVVSSPLAPVKPVVTTPKADRPVQAPKPVVVPQTPPQVTEVSERAPLWPLVLGGGFFLAGLGFIFWRRKKSGA